MPIDFPPSWEPSSMMSRVGSWNLAADTELLKQLADFSNAFLDKVSCINESLNKTIENADSASTLVKNSCSKLLLLSNKQFVENRVYEDDENIQHYDKRTVELSGGREKTVLQNVTQSIKFGLEMLESNYPHQIKSSSEGHTALKPKNPYENRSLPIIIGTDQFYVASVTGYTVPEYLENSSPGSLKISQSCSSQEIDEQTPKLDGLISNNVKDLSPPESTVINEEQQHLPTAHEPIPDYIKNPTNKIDLINSESVNNSDIPIQNEAPDVTEPDEWIDNTADIPEKLKAKKFLLDIHSSNLFKSQLFQNTNDPTTNSNNVSSLFSDDSDDDLFSSKNTNPLMESDSQKERVISSHSKVHKKEDADYMKIHIEGDTAGPDSMKSELFDNTVTQDELLFKGTNHLKAKTNFSSNAKNEVAAIERSQVRNLFDSALKPEMKFMNEISDLFSEAGVEAASNRNCLNHQVEKPHDVRISKQSDVINKSDLFDDINSKSIFEKNKLSPEYSFIPKVEISHKSALGNISDLFDDDDDSSNKTNVLNVKKRISNEGRKYKDVTKDEDFDIFKELDEEDIFKERNVSEATKGFKPSNESFPVSVKKNQPFTYFLDSSDEDDDLFSASKVRGKTSSGTCDQGTKPLSESTTSLYDGSDDFFKKTALDKEESNRKFFTKTESNVIIHKFSSKTYDIDGKLSEQIMPSNFFDTKENYPIFDDAINPTNTVNMFSKTSSLKQPIDLFAEQTRPSRSLPHKFQNIFDSSDENEEISDEPSKIESDGFCIEGTTFDNKESEREPIASNTKIVSEEDDTMKDIENSYISENYDLEGSSDNHAEDLFKSTLADNVGAGDKLVYTEKSDSETISEEGDRKIQNDINTSPQYSCNAKKTTTRSCGRPDSSKMFFEELRGALNKQLIPLLNSDLTERLVQRSHFKAPVNNATAELPSIFDTPPKPPLLSSINKSRARRKKQHKPRRPLGNQAYGEYKTYKDEIKTEIKNIQAVVSQSNTISSKSEDGDLALVEDDNDLIGGVSHITENLQVSENEDYVPPSIPNLFVDDEDVNSLSTSLTIPQTDIFLDDSDEDIDLFKVPFPSSTRIENSKSKIVSLFSDSDDDIEDIFSK